MVPKIQRIVEAPGWMNHLKFHPVVKVPIHLEQTPDIFILFMQMADPCQQVMIEQIDGLGIEHCVVENLRPPCEFNVGYRAHQWLENLIPVVVNLVSVCPRLVQYEMHGFDGFG